MSTLTLTRTRIKSGTYEGLLITKARLKSDPVLELRYRDTTLGRVSVIADAKAQKTWNVRVEIPASSIFEGVQTFIITDVDSGKTLDSFAMITGAPLQDDLLSEVKLLRAELEMLKQAFRKHIVETTK
ncbi:MAG: hypothetical protein ACI861_001054 [Paracoccaceae bacterium]|jgi:hypothetical protein